MNSLVILTKKFPFGKQETYLFNELSILNQKFDRIILIPYDEYEYDIDKNRMVGFAGVEVFPINLIYKEKGFSKYKAILFCLGILTHELIRGRHKGRHFTKLKSAVVEGMHAFRQASRLNAFLTENNITNTVLYNYWLHRGVIISAALNKISESHFPIVSRAHAFDLYNEFWFKIMEDMNDNILYFNDFKLHICDEVYSISAHGINFLNEKYPKYKSKFSIQRLGVLNEQIMQVVNSNKNTVIVTCSSVNERKRIYLIPQLMKEMETDVRWVHFGGGSEEELDKVARLIKEYGLSDRVELKGSTPHNEIIEYYKNNRVDLFLNVSTVEGIPVSLMEAASFGIPMLATDTVGNPEIVNEDNGFVVPVNFSIENVGQQLDQYFINSNEILRKRGKSKEMYLELYSAEKNYNQLAVCIKGVSKKYKNI